MLLQVFCAAATVAADPPIYVVTHHKSGTHAARVFSMPWCIDERKAVEVNRGPGFLRECEKNGLILKVDGILDTDILVPGSIVVHFVRNPIDMIVSGYLYHRGCQERSWTETWRIPKHKASRYPTNLHPNNLTQPFIDALQGEYNGSYCRFLQAAPPDVGIQAEAIRTMHADDGVGRMMNNSAHFAQGNFTVIKACMSDLNPLTNINYAANYAAIYSQIPGIDVARIMARFSRYKIMTDIKQHTTRGEGPNDEKGFLVRCFWEAASAEFFRQNPALGHMRFQATRCASEFCDSRPPPPYVYNPHAPCRHIGSRPESGCRWFSRDPSTFPY